MSQITPPTEPESWWLHCTDVAPVDRLFEAGWLDDEAEEICAYARDTGLTVAEVERLAKLCLRADTPVSYRALRLYHLHWPVSG